MTNLWTSGELNRFVADSDELGGPGNPACEAFWQQFEYSTRIEIEDDLDPYGEAYMGKMLALYSEISQRSLNQLINEETPFDLATHAAAPNPYAHQAPKALAKQITTLVQAVSAADKPKDSHLLDLGSGWGLSSEIFEYVGYRVTAVDISERFVQLVNLRAQKRSLAINAIRSSFEDFRSSETFDIAVFFECLHHSVEPWVLLSRLSQNFKPDGILLLLAEPVQNSWWKHWGLRLDPLSIYCIRKFGWFESGWSNSFLFDMLSRAGFSGLSVKNQGNPDHSIYLCRRAISLSRLDLEKIAAPEQFWIEPDYMVSKGDVTLEFCLPCIVTAIAFEICNFRPRRLQLTFHINDREPISYSVEPGRSHIVMPYAGGMLNARIVSECWCPKTEIGNADTRMLSFHLASISGRTAS